MQRVSLKTFLSITLILSIIGALVFRSPNSAHADTYNLYASNCSGGWEHADFATGTPDVLGPQIAQFNESNSALLRSGSQAQIACGDFRGEVGINTAPRRVAAKFSWAATYPSEVRAILEQRELREAEKLPAGSTTQAVDAPSSGNSETSASALIASSTAASSSSESGIEVHAASSTATTTLENVAATTSEEVIPPANTTTLPTVDRPVTATTSDSVSGNTTPAVPVDEVPLIPAPAVLEEAGGVPVSAESSEPTPPADTAVPLSFFDFFIHSAFAEEVVVATTTMVEVSSSTQLQIAVDATSTTLLDAVATNTLSGQGDSVSATTSPYGLVEVVYSFDEIAWKSLGYIEHDEFDTKKFEIPVDEIVGWDDISNIHVGVRSIPTLDAVAPIIYLDAVWLEVEYEKIGEDPHPAPSLLRGDTYLREVAYGDAVAVLVHRPVSSDAPVYTFSSSTASTSEVIVFAEATTTTTTIDSDRITELWLHNNTEKRWLFIADRKQVSEDSKIFFDYGNVFWTGKDGALWKYNVSSNSFESVSPDVDGTVMVEFRDESSGLKKIILESSTTSPLFLDVPEVPLSE